MFSRSVAAGGLVSGMVFLAAPASATPIPLCVTSYASTPATCNMSATVLGTPGSYSYADSTLQPAASTGGIIANSKYPGSYPGASFYDAYLIKISNSQGDTISSTIDLTFPGQPAPSYQITNFQERLYAYSATNNVAPFVGPVSGAKDLWTTPVIINGANSGTVAALPATFLPMDTYVLEVRGDVTGTFGGAYSGTFQLAPVPLPAGLPLLLSGLGSLGLFARRRGSKAAVA